LALLSHRQSLAAKWTLKQVQGDGFFRRYGFSNKPRTAAQRHPELVSGSIARFAQSMLLGHRYDR
jgi:hypothetical protein